MRSGSLTRSEAHLRRPPRASSHLAISFLQFAKDVLAYAAGAQLHPWPRTQDDASTLSDPTEFAPQGLASPSPAAASRQNSFLSRRSAIGSHHMKKITIRSTHRVIELLSPPTNKTGWRRPAPIGMTVRRFFHKRYRYLRARTAFLRLDNGALVCVRNLEKLGWDII